jgi:hypothetical protein
MNLVRPISIDRFGERAFGRQPIGNGITVPTNYWNDLNTSSSSCWDVNYNTGLVSFKQPQHRSNVVSSHNLSLSSAAANPSYRVDNGSSKMLSFH